jgi:uroporphyrinogen-III synthase
MATGAGSATVAGPAPLTGFTVGVTAARRRDELAALLRRHGARVLEAPTVRVVPSAEPDPDAEPGPNPIAEPNPDADAVRRLVGQTARRELQAVAFTSAPALTGFLDAADGQGLLARVLDVLRLDAERGGVLPVCAGPLCARALEERGVTPTCPDRAGPGSLVRTLVQTLPRGNRDLLFAEHRLTLQGSAVLASGQCLWLSPIQAALLRALADRPGRVLSRAELLRRVWAGGGADEHAVEAAVARLRGSLGPYAALVHTVTKRGYRLAAVTP